MTDAQQDHDLHPESDAAGSFFHLVKRSRVLVLLLALLAQIALSPWMDQFPLMDALLNLGLILAAIYTVADQSRHLKWGLALGVPAVVLLLLGRILEMPSLQWAGYLFALMLYLMVIRLFLFQIFRAPEVTLDTIGMALCTYVLLGALWMLFYTPILTLDPEAFAFNTAVVPGAEGKTLTYFSYVTLTTLGYGDIVPVSDLARSLAILEALTGTLFLAVLISRLVGKYRSSTKS